MAPPRRLARSAAEIVVERALASPVATTFYAGSPAGQPAHREAIPASTSQRARPNRPPDSRLFARARGTIILPIVLPAVTSIATGPRIAQNLQISFVPWWPGSIYAPSPSFYSGRVAVGRPAPLGLERTMACPLPPWPGPASQMLRFATCLPVDVTGTA